MTLTLFSYLIDVMNIGEGSNALGKTASKLFWKIENCSFWPNFCEIWPWPSFALLFLVDLIEINIFPNIMSIQKSYRFTVKKLFMFKVKFQIISWPLTLTLIWWTKDAMNNGKGPKSLAQTITKLHRKIENFSFWPIFS